MLITKTGIKKLLNRYNKNEKHGKNDSDNNKEKFTF